MTASVHRLEMACNKIQVFARLKPSKRPTEKLKQQEDSIVVHTSEEQADGTYSKAPGLSYQFKFAKVKRYALDRALSSCMAADYPINTLAAH